ncbi:hypothetical protein HDU87_008282 [Geranomyces variabilis]|uniref:UPF3 domain-containing protein n=1 Tax=Geranomyces variabilis TaxID=109894 RepID=A0AAD5TD37_9FUNG|nr:hypothetical protein HDU87_008282 [Geranomyces variabilis]
MAAAPQVTLAPVPSAAQQDGAEAATAKPSSRSSRNLNRTAGPKQKQPQAKTKIVIRRLPPNLPEEIFKGSVAQWLEDADWWTFVAGKVAKSQAKMSVFSTAYVNFKTIDVMLDFCNTYKGLFVDSKGNESRAIIEFAPFQRIPKKKKKADTRMNTINDDTDYLKFLKSLEEPAPVRPNEADGSLEKKLTGDQTASAAKGILSSTSVSYASALTSAAPANPKSTPLLDALRAQKAGMRAAAESAKQANLAAKNAANEKKKTAESKALADDKRQPGKKAAKAAARKNAEKSAPSSSGSQQQSSTPKRENSEASLSSLAGQPKAMKSPEKKKKEPTGKQRERPTTAAASSAGSSDKIAPPGSLFNKSLGAVLGKREPKKARGTETESATGAASPQGTQTTIKTPPASVPALVPAANQPAVENAGRGYKSKRQAASAAAAAATKAKLVSPKASRSGKGPGGDRVDVASAASSATDASLGGQQQTQGKGSPSAPRQSVATTTPAKRSGISVSVVNRDGTSSSYHTGGD